MSKRSRQRSRDKRPGRQVEPHDQPAPKSSSENDEITDPRVPVVAIGASAGGLEPLERLFDAMPVDTGFAFVVVQHLSPDFRSMMDELLARHSRMMIRHASSGLTISSNVIYLNPPRQNIQIAGNQIQLVAPDASEVPNHPIDAFFTSLANDRRDGSIGIILSGTGNDGTHGAFSILKAGGTVIVQEPSSAQFDSMPRNAIEKGASTSVAAPEMMPDLLTDLFRGIVRPQADGDEEDLSLDPEDAILALLDKRFEANFAYYKKATVRRRLARRASISGIQNLANYYQTLRSDSDEVERLYADLLIGVTAFFRDSAAFDLIASEIIPKIASKMSLAHEVRIWVPGCASGEEAFSIAIMLAEYARENGLALNAKIFGTDLHSSSLQIASQGLYAAERLQELPPDLLARYFDKMDSKYRVKAEIRRLIMFSRHNVIRDPPFTRLDMISCRNMLIYFDDVAQKKVLSHFHFALKQDSFLFLGPSESVGDILDEFDTIDSRWRIYCKVRNAQLPGVTRMLLPPQGEGSAMLSEAGRLPTQPRPPPPTRLDRRPLLHAYDAMLARYAPPGLLVSRNGELLHILGDAQKYVRLRTGVISTNMADVIAEPLKHIANACLDEVRLTGSVSVTKEVTFDDNNKQTTVQVRGEQLTAGSSEQDQILVTLTEVANAKGSVAHSNRTIEQFGESQALRGRVGELERNLRFTEESLQTTIEELETSNEELQSTNEELMSANEELQSTNEELQAVNEELYSISSEHQRKIEELTLLSNDMNHRTSDVGTLFLDKELRIRRFTPAVATAFNLLDIDIGRSIEGIKTRFEYPELADEVRQVAASGTTVERTVEFSDASMLLRILPFRVEKATEGVVISMVDVSQMKQIERTLEAKNEELGRLIASLEQFTYIVSHDLRAPLRSIHNSANWIVEDLGEDVSEDIRGHCSRLVTYARRLTAMLDDLREYARLDIGDKAMSKVDLGALLHDIVDAFDTELKLKLDFDSFTVNCHRAAVSLVFQNLLENALKYAGRPDVEVGVTAEDKGTFYEFQVSDNGPGIPARHHEKIFLPFRRLESGDEKSGTGMGLALVKKAIDDNGGNISVLSDPEAAMGTKFTFTWAKTA